jgi:NADPH2:quinone reductase
VHVVYDGVGKATFDKDLNVLRPRGYLVLFGGSSGAVPPFDLIKLSQKGSLFITRPTLAHYTATREELEWRANDVLQSIARGELKLRIHKVIHSLKPRRRIAISKDERRPASYYLSRR